jgi:uncharacterized protein (TIGR00288 family)
MASSNENVSMALFCDFENVALGVRDANYDKFDIKPVLERLLLKGSIVVKKAYCDWDRYKSFKAPMHEANFELIEIPHVRQSGKNSADIRMVVDALDLCYTKSHVDTFVIISGDSDFSPLVSKLRENAKKVIGVGVKQSTSDLLVANCDEFIFYDDLVRESRRARRETSNDKPQVKRSPEEERARRDEMEKRRSQAVEIAVDTFEALVLERGDSGKIWASVLKEAIKRRKPDFSESYYGFRTFGNLIEECKARGYLEFGRDEKSGAYVYRGSGVQQPASEAPAVVDSSAATAPASAPAEGGQQESRRSRNRGRTAAERFAERQAQRLTQQQRGPQGGTDDEGDAAANAVAADVAPPAGIEPAPAAAPWWDNAPAGATSDEAAPADAQPTDTAAPAQANAQARKKNGPKPPARKLKEQAKKGKDSASTAAPAEAAPASEAAPVATTAAVAAPKAADAAPSDAAAPKARPAGKSRSGKPNAGKPKAAAAAAPVADAAPAAEAAPAADKPAKAKPARKPAAASKPRAPKAKAAAPTEE